MAIPKCTPNPRISKFLLEIYASDNIHDLFPSWGHVNPIGPRACYDEGKRIAETLTYGYHKQDGVDVRVARIFNTYGDASF
jgi:UDP-glucuronate decarboxylase